MINSDNPEEFLDTKVSYKTYYITGGISIVGSVAFLSNLIF